MAKMHKDYTIADMLRLGGAWVKTYNDIEAIQKIAGTLAMMDKSINDVTIEPFMRADKSIENDNEKIRAICLGIADGIVHEVKPPVKIDAAAKSALKQRLSAYSSELMAATKGLIDVERELANRFAQVRSAAKFSLPDFMVQSINPTESSTFEYIGECNDASIFVQTVPVNHSRVDAGGDLTQRCLGRMVAMVTHNSNGSIHLSICGVIDGITDRGCRYFHPNVSSSGNLCFGEVNDKAAVFAAKGDVCGLLSVADKVLRTSQYGKPYIHLYELLDSKRAPYVLYESDVLPLIEGMAKTSGNPSTIHSNWLKMIPHDDIVSMVRVDGDGLVDVKETNDPDVYDVGSEVVRYMPRALFSAPEVFPIPESGVHIYGNGAVVIDGAVATGEVSIYAKPLQVGVINPSGLTGIYSGLLFKNGVLYDIIANVVSGEIIAAIASADAQVLRLGPNNFPMVKLTHEARVPIGSKRIADTGIGLLYIANNKQVVHITRDGRDDSPSVEGADSMRDYWFSRVEV